jgi:hypothetical protein
MKIIYTLTICILSLSCLLQARTWTDNQGRSFEGDLVSTSQSEVTIQRSSDEASLTIPKNILSQADQIYLQELSQNSSSFFHRKTGIILPSAIETLKLEGKHTYDRPELGESVAYQGKNSTATIYFYDYGISDIKDDPEHHQISSELSRATSDLRKAEEIGIYDNVTINTSGVKSGKEGIFTFISLPASYTVVKNPRTNEPSPPIETISLIGVGIYKGHYIKLRYSITPGSDIEESLKTRDQFISALISLIIEVDLRPIVMEYLETYFNDPLSTEGRNALGAISTYAEESHLVRLSMNLKIAPWLSIDDYAYGSELLGAYIAGQVHSQLSSGIYKSNEAAGREQVLRVYKTLRLKDKKAIVKELENELVTDDYTVITRDFIYSDNPPRHGLSLYLDSHHSPSYSDTVL